jgi:hypothetical protein
MFDTRKTKIKQEVLRISNMLVGKEIIDIIVDVVVQPKSKSILIFIVIVGTLNCLMMSTIIHFWMISMRECYRHIGR